MSTSLGYGLHAARPGSIVHVAAVMDYQLIDWSAMQTISSCLSAVNVNTQKHCTTRLQTFWPLWVLRLSEEKTFVVGIDEGFDFLGFRIQRHYKPGTSKQFVYTFPSRKSVASIKQKVKTITTQGTHQPLVEILKQLNLTLPGWTRYFQYGVSAHTFAYLRHYTWNRVVIWLRNKHRKTNWKSLRHRYGPNGWWPVEEGVELFNPAAVPVSRYRYRGDIPTPWIQPAPA